jgi:trehalose synthase
VQRYAKGDPDIFLFADLKQIKHHSISTFVNAFQTGADVVLAKSIREGFGLVVTEAMWKGKSVIGGNVGGIRHQIVDGESGFLVNSSDEAAERMEQLLTDDKLSVSIGKAAKKRVQENFLMPRLLLDYLKLFEELTI